MVKNLDTGSLIVILVTFVLFALALFTKGFTHDLLLETGVFLVSVKLIIMAYRNNVNNQVIAKDLSEIKATLRGKEKTDE
ncbi:hypothetical protein ACFL2E_00305 [Thermodesulfobacteriota bacterium]